MQKFAPADDEELQVSVRLRVLERDSYRCQKCGGGQALTLHHMVRVSEGGSNAAENLLTLCRTCHTDWHRLEEWYLGVEFSEWLEGGLAIQKALEKASILKWVILIRSTGGSYGELARCLNVLALRTPQGRDWTSSNIRKWVMRHVPESAIKRNLAPLGWPDFLEQLDDRLFRWWHYQQPIALLRLGNRNRWFAYRYDFRSVQLRELHHFKGYTGKLRGVVALCDGIRLTRRKSFSPSRLKDTKVGKLLIQSGPEMRLSQRIAAARYKFCGPIFSLPKGWGMNSYESWLPWQAVEAILLALQSHSGLPSIKRPR